MHHLEWTDASLHGAQQDPVTRRHGWRDRCQAAIAQRDPDPRDRGRMSHATRNPVREGPNLRVFAPRAPPPLHSALPHMCCRLLSGAMGPANNCTATALAVEAEAMASAAEHGHAAAVAGRRAAAALEHASAAAATLVCRANLAREIAGLGREIAMLAIESGAASTLGIDEATWLSRARRREPMGSL